MIGLIIFLLIVIKSLTATLLNAARNSRTDKGVGTALIAGILLAGAMMMAQPAVAKEGTNVQPALVTGSTAGSVAPSLVNGLSDTAFYMIMCVIALEIMVILYLLYNLNSLLKANTVDATTVAVEARNIRPAWSLAKWWTKMNRFRPVAEEEGLDLGHDYDGIRELDNKLPPWWLYGFYCTMIFAVIYMWRYHVSHSAPLPAEEYQIAVKLAAVEKEAYLKKAANSVDESTVKVLTSPSDLEAGKSIFQTACFACHGKNGEGGVGPNLTDAYWLHGGSIQEVFRTIKYGWPDKGMKSWKDDYSPAQIAQIASYVRSLAGTNPENAKPPQGILVK